jgi:hypothetical protein
MVQLMAFINHVSLLRCSIELTQPAAEPTDTAPLAIPQSIASFLAQSIGISIRDVADAWNISKDTIWEMDTVVQRDQVDEDAFREHGWRLGVSEFCSTCKKWTISHEKMTRSLFDTLSAIELL